MIYLLISYLNLSIIVPDKIRPNQLGQVFTRYILIIKSNQITFYIMKTNFGFGEY
jgi:hypothetical protein